MDKVHPIFSSNVEGIAVDNGFYSLSIAFSVSETFQIKPNSGRFWSSKILRVWVAKICSLAAPYVQKFCDVIFLGLKVITANEQNFKALLGFLLLEIVGGIPVPG